MYETLVMVSYYSVKLQECWRPRLYYTVFTVEMQFNFHIQSKVTCYYVYYIFFFTATEDTDVQKTPSF